MSINPLDQILGDGAFEEYCQACILRIGTEIVDVPEVTVGEYDTNILEKSWPPEEGPWAIVIPTWKHGAFPTLFSNESAYMQEGSGCGTPIQPEMFDFFMKQFVRMNVSEDGEVADMMKWSRKWGVKFSKYPVPENLVASYENIGCVKEAEIDTADKKLFIMVGDNDSSSNFSEWMLWASLGCPEESKPQWVID